ncbi:MAG: hypothetical protein GX998_09945 [Firmicutes bacterium]|nr:hypothetical protein [Bacillota bacterium]
MCATDIDILAARVEAILPDSIARRLQLSILADSLAYVHTRDAAICLIHVLSDRIRLFAGRLIVLTLEGNRVWVTTDGTQAVDHLSRLRSWEWGTGSYPEYKRPPSRNGYYSPLQDVGQDWFHIQESHFAYLERVMNRFKNVDSRSVAKHEPLMVKYLSTVLPWDLSRPNEIPISEEVPDPESYWEGSVQRISVNKFERDRKARAACLRHFGYRCAACGMSFAERYGPEARGIIHVHHVVPLSEIGEGYSLDPVRDLVPVCPNCHAVIHASGTNVRHVEDVGEMLGRVQDDDL